jgi:hypothetical protein
MGEIKYYVTRLLIVRIVDRNYETLAGVSNRPFSAKKKNGSFVSRWIGPAKHPDCLGMETVAGFCLSPCHALHRKKARVGVRLASVSSYDSTNKNHPKSL